MVVCPLIESIEDHNLNHAAKILESGYTSKSAMFYAITRGSYMFVELFSKTFGKLPKYLEYAVKKCNYNIVKLLIKCGYVSKNALYLAIKHDYKDIVELFDNKEQYPYALDVAIYYRNEDIILLLIGKGYTSRFLADYVLDNDLCILALKIIYVYRKNNLNNDLDYAMMAFAIVKNKIKFVKIFAICQFGLNWETLTLAYGQPKLFPILAEYKS